jgi:hypothetical protein
MRFRQRNARKKDKIRAKKKGPTARPGPNEPLHVTAALLRFVLNPNSRVWAAAPERRR